MSGRGTHPLLWYQGFGSTSGSGCHKSHAGSKAPMSGRIRIPSWNGMGPVPSPWGRGARVPGLSLPAKATRLLPGRAPGESGSLSSSTSREGWFLTHCRLYSQQINNFLLWQRHWPVSACAGGSHCPPSRLSPLPEGPCRTSRHPRPQLGSFQLRRAVRSSPAVPAAASGTSRREQGPGCELMMRVPEVAGKRLGWRRGRRSSRKELPPPLGFAAALAALGETGEKSSEGATSARWTLSWGHGAAAG